MFTDFGLQTLPFSISTSFFYAITHVFFPVELPDENDYTPENDYSLVRAVCAAAHAYRTHIRETSEQDQWCRIIKMLDNLQTSVQPEHMGDDHVLISQLCDMQTGDVLAFLIRPQNAAIVLTKHENYVLCEAFKVPPSTEDVERTPGPLKCSYPGSAIKMPSEVFDDKFFQLEFATFLSRCDVSLPRLSPPRYIIALLDNVLHGGNTDGVHRITKRIRDEVGFHHPDTPLERIWRRSLLWLLVRVAIQMLADCSLGRTFYKRFMLFFMCTLARDECNTNLSSTLLHLMSSRILRRLGKLGSSSPDWLSKMALGTCTGLRQILNTRWEQLNTRPSPFRNPSQDDLKRDTQLSLQRSHRYIRNALANHSLRSVTAPLHPHHRRRGTIENFLSSNGSFFQKAYRADPDVTLYDVEQSVEQGIDDWLSRVINVDRACEQLDILMDKYMEKAFRIRHVIDPEDISIALLTGIELFVALDKLVVKKIPMLADYSPEIPIEFLEELFLRRTTSLHRLSCAYQYLSMRYSHSRLGWSALSDNFTEDSFPVCYYDQSPHLQQLQTRIERDAMQKAAGHSSLRGGGTDLANTHDDCTRHLLGQQRTRSTEFSRLPLPALQLHAKVVVFELQCPVCIRTWRSSVLRILHYFRRRYFHNDEGEDHLLRRVSALQPYFVDRQGPPLRVQVHFAYFYPGCSQSPVLRYAVQHFNPFLDHAKDYLSVWTPEILYQDSDLPYNIGYNIQDCCSSDFDECVHYTSCTSNDILSALELCPADLPLEDFIALSHVRSGGSLQWLNILRGLRSRTLNLRHPYVHLLLSTVAFQVGPLDLNTGVWIWHQELQDSSFIHSLLDELEDLFMDVGVAVIDGVWMNTISLMLTRILALSSTEDILQRVLALLRRVRRITFDWVRELLYDLTKAPTNKGRSDLLRDMAATYRSTFDIDPTILCTHLLSAEDIDALISCAILVRTYVPQDNSFPPRYYSGLLITRDSRLSLALEKILRDMILTDVSDYGIDLAIGRISTSYQPSTHRWEPCQGPNDRWLTCINEATVEQPFQTIQINLLNGEFRVTGRPLSGLSHEIRSSPEYQRIFCFKTFTVVPSDLPGMDFMTLPLISKHKVHFSLHGEKLVIRAQNKQTNEILDLIPSSKLQGDLPQVLIDDHVHWLNLLAKIIEIRPLHQLWEYSSENWKIDCASRPYRMYKGCETLVDIRSPTWEMVSKCFDCLNDVDEAPGAGTQTQYRGYLIATSPVDSNSIQSSSASRLLVTLLHYNLSFFVNERDELESRDFKNMVYDEDQCIGTLFGLENILVLRPKTHIGGGLIPRRVLIPGGFPRTHDNHRVRIDASPTCRTLTGPFYTYDVDTDLGCLTGNGTLMSMLFLAYLHTMTNCHRPDPLTGKTGVGAGLYLLQSAGCRSIMEPKAPSGDYCWNSTPYPQINALCREIQYRYYWIPAMDIRKLPVTVREKRASQRASYLFPSIDTRPTSPKDCIPGLRHHEDDFWKEHTHLEPGPPTLLHSIPPHDEHLPRTIVLDQLLCDRVAPELPPRASALLFDSHSTSLDNIPAVDQLFSSLRPDSPFQREYLVHLDISAQSVRAESRMTYKVTARDCIDVLQRHYVKCRTSYTDALGIIQKSLGPTTGCRQTVEQFNHWPPITADVLLRYLASTSPIQIPLRWKKCLISLALLLLDLQRARRLFRIALERREEELSKELENEVCDGWNPEEYPDWLLIQIQGNFLVRRKQAETAMELISPRSRENTVMQVNMGEGKSSVIIPIAAAALADGKQLVRVIVPKALTCQMFDLLVSRIGGLTNRPVYHIPFSRTTKYDGEDAIGLQIDDLRELMSQCMAERGILLIQPEHVVSLKLMSVGQQIHKGKLVDDWLTKHQRRIYEHIKTALSLGSIPGDGHIGNIFSTLKDLRNQASNEDTDQAKHHNKLGHGDAAEASDDASKWLSLQRWLRSHVRDILDESDEILHPRFQLIYTMGTEQYLDGYPDRWTITQQVLRLVKKHVCSISRYSPDSVQYERGPPGSFPRIRIMRGSDVGQRLISLITEDVMAGRLPGFNFEHISQTLHDAIRSFISDEDVIQIPDTVKRVEEYAVGPDKSHLWSGLLLLRGLLTSNILLFALSERRWRVDYGPVSEWPRQRSTMLAVPYRAKDEPKTNTQFGHPDLMIILTCLSYYYAGLSEEELRVSFELLLRQDDPSTEYGTWIKEYDRNSVPASLERLTWLNLNASEQWDEVIFPLFSKNQATVDFYLSQVVFAKEAKGFPWKLSGSSWDLAEKRERLITGFSGTNDSRWLLPTSIAQRDLDHEKGTNTRVLAYILRPENSFYMLTHKSGEQWSTPTFLRLVATQCPGIRVLLDIGSQILDLSNWQVARAWLEITGDAAGAIYFDDNDDLVVLARNGVTSQLLSSPLLQQLDRCVVYLDHAHTRGTDMKLPIGSRAAVTLGPKVTKDALVQGCMRMRKLGHGHSVMFFAPPEVDWSIRVVVAKTDPDIPITTNDILCWAIHETWADIQSRAPYWARQGMDHKTRYDAWSRFCDDELTLEEFSAAWLQRDDKSLADLYAPRQTKGPFSTLPALAPELRQRCKDLGVLSLPGAQMEEEQEREVQREREREREAELPPMAEPAEHFLHPDVITFVNTGVIPPLYSESAFLPVFTTLEKSSAATCETDVWSPSILATVDFCNTIEPESTEGTIDQYLRPVQWILSCHQGRDQVLVLLSPFEADELMPDIRASEHVHLHVYTPRTSKRMKPSDDLRFYSIPPLPSDWTPPWNLIDQLNIFAGQLYLRDYESYLRLCRFLDVPTKKSPNNDTIRRNLFNIPGSFEAMEVTFSGSPLPFVMALLAIRNRGRPFAHTHMGKILQGQILSEKDFEGSPSTR